MRPEPDTYGLGNDADRRASGRWRLPGGPSRAAAASGASPVPTTPSSGRAAGGEDRKWPFHLLPPSLRSTGLQVPVSISTQNNNDDNKFDGSNDQRISWRKSSVSGCRSLPENLEKSESIASSPLPPPPPPTPPPVLEREKKARDAYFRFISGSLPVWEGEGRK